MFVHLPLVVYLCVSECISMCVCVCDIARRMMRIDYETCTSMSGTILPTMCELLVCRVPYCQECVKFGW